MVISNNFVCLPLFGLSFEFYPEIYFSAVHFGGHTCCLQYQEKYPRKQILP
jgi:hypothetical protein